MLRSHPPLLVGRVRGVNRRKCSRPKTADAVLNRYQRVENCNYAVSLCKPLKLKYVSLHPLVSSRLRPCPCRQRIDYWSRVVVVGSLVNVSGLDIVDMNTKLIMALLWQVSAHRCCCAGAARGVMTRVSLLWRS